MRDSIWALIVIGILTHRTMDLYGVYSKWAQVHRQYVSTNRAPVPESLSWVVENFIKLSMAILLVMLVLSSAVISGQGGIGNSIISTVPALAFSIVVSFLGAYADFHRECFATTAN
jgi:ABC-type glycerol-3-phosphate transport system permease component